MRRFLPYLWPKGEAGLRARIVFALLLVVVSKLIQLSMAWVYGQAIDRMVPGMEDSVAIAIALVAAYAGARFGGVLFDNLRNVVFERVGQEATRRLAENVFSHLHNLSMRFHMNRRTGAVTKVIERGTKSIDIMLYFLLFNIAPTLLELVLVSAYFKIEFGWGMVAATLIMVVSYIAYTTVITNWRNKLREEMNELDTQTVAKSVDSLLNYETVKYFNAEKRETRRYAEVVHHYANAAVKSENSLAALNIGQSLITNLMMAGAMGYVVWGWSRGQFTTGDVVTVTHIRVSEVEAIEDLEGIDEDRTRFDVGYGLCFGHNERKAIAMANLDIACHRDAGHTQLEQSLLLTTDALDSAGFLEHLKLPHIAIVLRECLGKHVRAVVAADEVEVLRIGGHERRFDRCLESHRGTPSVGGLGTSAVAELPGWEAPLASAAVLAE